MVQDFFHPQYVRIFATVGITPRKALFFLGVTTSQLADEVLQNAIQVFGRPGRATDSGVQAVGIKNKTTTKGLISEKRSIVIYMGKTVVCCL